MMDEEEWRGETGQQRGEGTAWGEGEKLGKVGNAKCDGRRGVRRRELGDTTKRQDMNKEEERILGEETR